MKPNVTLFLVALLGAAVTLPAQFRDGRRAESRRVVAVASPSHGHADRGVGQRVARRTANERFDRQVHQREVRNHPILVPPLRQHGHWETRIERVLVPGYWQWQEVPATYGWVYSSCGHRHWEVIRPACRHRVWVPERWQECSRRVWVGC